MLDRFQNYLVNQLSALTFESDDERYLYLMSIAANVFALAAHTYLLLIFAAFGHTFFTWLGVFSVTCYVLMFQLVRRRKYVAFGLAISAEVAIYATIYGVMTGMESNIIAYFMLVIVMQVMVPYGTPKLRAAVVGGIVLCVTACIVSNFVCPPPIVFEERLYNTMLISNIYILIVGTTVELYIGNLAKVLIDRVNKAKMDELSSQAYTDPLTGLYNRRYAEMYFEKQRRRKSDKSSCVAMIDIDDFKQVNDTLGHSAGDEALVFLSNFLLQSLRHTDIVFRWGGEEFLVVLTDVGLDNAKEVLEKIRERLALAVVPTMKGDIRMTVSIGVALLGYDNVQQGIEASDENLYRAKNSGKNKVVAPAI